MKGQLHGHSGCKLEVLRSSARTYVRKTSRSIDYNPRLIAQAKKQSDSSFEGVKSPEVFHIGCDAEGLAFFDMEYIPGMSFAKFLGNVSLEQVEILAEKIYGLKHQGGKVHGKKCSSLVVQKILDLEKIIENFEGSDEKKMAQAFGLLKGHSWDIDGNDFCHGDLTFENIIVFKGELYLIDHLDSFCDSWKIDFSKILQDLESRWSYRYEQKIIQNLAVRLDVFKNCFFKLLLKDNTTDKDIRELYLLLLLNILRIIPYSGNDPVILKYLDTQVGHCLNLFSNNMELVYENINYSLRRKIN